MTYCLQDRFKDKLEILFADTPEQLDLAERCINYIRSETIVEDYVVVTNVVSDILNDGNYGEGVYTKRGVELSLLCLDVLDTLTGEGIISEKGGHLDLVVDH